MEYPMVYLRIDDLPKCYKDVQALVYRKTQPAIVATTSSHSMREFALLMHSLRNAKAAAQLFGKILPDGMDDETATLYNELAAQAERWEHGFFLDPLIFDHLSQLPREDEGDEDFYNWFRIQTLLAGRQLKSDQHGQLGQSVARRAEIQQDISRRLRAEDAETFFVAEAGAWEDTGIAPWLVEKTRQDDGSLIIPRAMIIPFVAQCNSQALRHAAWRARNSIGEQNWPLVEEVAGLCQEEAELLMQQEGLALHAPTWARVASLRLNYLYPGELQRTIDHALLAFGLASKREVSHWKEQLGLDTLALPDFIWAKPQMVAQALPEDFDLSQFTQFENVWTALTALAAQLGVTFRPIEAETWHPDVLVYEVYVHGASRGYLILDLFARESKAQGGFAEELQRPYPELDVPGIFFVKMDLGGQELEWEDIGDLFHEVLGHILQYALVGQGDTPQYPEVAVRYDSAAVEVLSTAAETWIYHPDFLQHLRDGDGQTIPEEVIAALKQTAMVGQAIMYELQGTYGRAFLTCAAESGATRAEIEQIWQSAMGEIALDDLDPKLPIVAPVTFPHGFDREMGYGAEYVAYVIGRSHAAAVNKAVHTLGWDSIMPLYYVGSMGAAPYLFVLKEALGTAYDANALHEELSR